MSIRKFFVDLDSKALVDSPSSPAVATIAPFYTGDVETLRLYFLRKSTVFQNPYNFSDLTGYGVSVGAGLIASEPTDGVWTISYGGQTTTTLAYNATAIQVAAALNALSTITAAGGVAVSGDVATRFQIRFLNVGTRDALTTNLEDLTPATTQILTTRVVGSATARQIVYLELAQAANAKAILAVKNTPITLSLEVLQPGGEYYSGSQLVSFSDRPLSGSFTFSIPSVSKNADAGAIVNNGLISTATNHGFAVGTVVSLNNFDVPPAGDLDSIMVSGSEVPQEYRGMYYSGDSAYIKSLLSAKVVGSEFVTYYNKTVNRTVVVGSLPSEGDYSSLYFVPKNASVVYENTQKTYLDANESPHPDYLPDYDSFVSGWTQASSSYSGRVFYWTKGDGFHQYGYFKETSSGFTFWQYQDFDLHVNFTDYNFRPISPISSGTQTVAGAKVFGISGACIRFAEGTPDNTLFPYCRWSIAHDENFLKNPFGASNATEIVRTAYFSLTYTQHAFFNTSANSRPYDYTWPANVSVTKAATASNGVLYKVATIPTSKTFTLQKFDTTPLYFNSLNTSTGTVSTQFETSYPVPYNATPAEVQSCLEKLSGIGTGNVVVGGSAYSYFAINFIGAKSNIEVPPLVVNSNNIAAPVYFEGNLAFTSEDIRDAIGDAATVPLTLEINIQKDGTRSTVAQAAIAVNQTLFQS